MASNASYNSSVNVIGVSDKKAQDALRKVVENCQWLKAELDAQSRKFEEELRRQKSYFDGKIA